MIVYVVHDREGFLIGVFTEDMVSGIMARLDNAVATICELNTVITKQA